MWGCFCFLTFVFQGCHTLSDRSNLVFYLVVFLFLIGLFLTYIGYQIAVSHHRLLSHTHRIGVVLFAPAAAIAGVPADINRAAGREARNRAGMAGAR